MVTRPDIKAGFVMLVGLFCTSALFAVQRDGDTSETARSSSESDQQSSETKDSSAKKTKRTPFGRSKSTREEEPKSSPPVTTPFMQVEEKGDSVVFRRRTPFGVQAWTKKRSELTAEEQKMLRDHQAKQAEAEPTRPGAPSAKAAPAARRSWPE